ncbi:hypothetical protein BR93DRAFT_923259 [Coniochaeta sp. PMI_546]|nr:hypothetical protein BR93DRAFT_923259 [Coniochaeta sp. PMI_546]
MNGTEARLYISWKQTELDYHMASVKSFLLQDPQHYVEFRMYVLNIVDWERTNGCKRSRSSRSSWPLFGTLST